MVMVRIYVVCQPVLMTYEDSAEERSMFAGSEKIELHGTHGNLIK